MGTRSRSAPPFSRHDVGSAFFLREDIETGPLYMDPADLAEFSSVRVYISIQGRAIYWVDDDKFLKLYSYLVDVSSIVSNMDLARTRLPVPRVLRYGYSGNCAYILMERVPYESLARVLRRWGLDYMPWEVTTLAHYIVRELASIGLRHNDLEPRNILVDRDGSLASVVDWDSCTPLHIGGEYARQISHNPSFRLPGEEDWFHIFLLYTLDRTGEEILLGSSRYDNKRLHYWPLVKSKAADIIAPPVTDPRNQSFSRQMSASMRVTT
ncbi:hypothetical protein BDP27DRAFT_1441718 [Rhodocollybia butyracea]|uniref:Protein kinase domain-containing protein n=1 Tax=Rhodocollybia butyracea TaxID=206335 RepID=A0A9P5Q3E9_9AGAR|nr:hypothetical protein BDP27DRAFT_1441718 [Rhodocollybia butyracea]